MIVAISIKKVGTTKMTICGVNAFEIIKAKKIRKHSNRRRARFISLTGKLPLKKRALCSLSDRPYAKAF